VDHKTYSFESWLKIIEERFGMNPMTGRDNTANDMSDAFDFTQQPRPPVILSGSGSPYPPAPQNQIHPAGTLVMTNSAYGTYAVAPETIATIYGSNLAAAPMQAQSQPLPTTLGGVTVTLKDASGASFAVPLIYVSPSQVNCVIPKGVAIGVATLIVSGNATSTGTAVIGGAAPGLYTANLTGQGPAAAQVTDGQTYSNTFQCASAGSCTLVPIDVSKSQKYVILYGTGIRGTAQANVSVRIGNIDIPVAFAGAQGGFAGLDQVNVALPAVLKGRGQLVVTVTVNGQATNMGQLAFQ
jgi:uncharacterized protein (TIGR03437 family)